LIRASTAFLPGFRSGERREIGDKEPVDGRVKPGHDDSGGRLRRENAVLIAGPRGADREA
jgi:hypothetical protein